MFTRLQEWAAWYSGDPNRLAECYAGYVTTYQRAPWYRFWDRAGRKRVERTSRTQIHMPLAGDIAATSAALLFSESPVVKIPEAHEGTENADAVATEARLLELVDAAGIEALLLEAAETCAAMGGVFLKVDWDSGVANYPFVTAVQADAALPEFRYGRLAAVTLWHTVGTNESGTTVWRHVERHEPGVVLHGLYRGNKQHLGAQQDLTAHSATAGLDEMVTLPFDGLAIRYIPNMRPNRVMRGSPLGQSDYSGSEGLLDALDETWTSWMRDIRLAKSRILVPEEYLQKSSDDGYLFDIDREVYAPLDMAPGDRNITVNQFAIRVDEHRETMLSLTEQIVSHAGYSPRSFGLRGDGSPVTAAEIRSLERKSLLTQQKKRRYWETPLADLLEMLLIVDRAYFNSATMPMRPAVTLADSLTETANELATTVALISNASAASTELKVRMLHPEWSDEMVLAEVARIQMELGIALPDTDEVGVA